MSVYVANSGSDTVSVIDQTTNTVVATIPGFSTPQQLDATPDGTRVYVANLANATVSVIDTAANAIVGTIAVGGGPNGIVVDRTGTRGYVTNSTDGTVSVLDLTNDTVIATVGVGINPVGVDVTPNNQFVYVANQISNTVSVIRTSDYTVVATIPTDATPIGVRVAPGGAYVYVTTRALGLVDIISVTSQTVVGTLPTGIAPIGVAANGSEVFVANEVSGTLSIIDPITNQIISSIATNAFPQYIAIDSSARFLYVSTRTNVVSVIDRQTNRIVASVPVGDQSIGIVVVPKFNRNPALRAQKTVNNAESITAMPGETVFFQLRVTNTGNTLLSQIAILDVIEPLGETLLSETIPSLEPGASIVREVPFVIPSPAPASALDNRLTAESALSGVFSEAHAAVILESAQPGLSVQKVGDRTEAAPGQSVTYTVTVTNTGTTDLTDIRVADPLAGFDQTISLLPAGESLQLQYAAIVPPGTAAGTEWLNTATASASDGTSAEGSFAVLVAAVPSLELTKEAEPATAVAGESIRYTFRLVNTGNTPLTGLVLSDPAIGASFVIDSLQIGATVVREADFVLPEGTPPGLFVNTATATSREGAQASASDSVQVAPTARIILNKTASPTQAAPGQTVTYTITVINAGTAVLTNVKVRDPFLGLDQVVDTLVPGARVSFTDTYTIPEDALAGTVITNTASAVTDQTPLIEQAASVTVLEVPDITLVKSVSPESARPGETVAYTLVVTNTGNTVLTSASVADPQGRLTQALPDLAPGESRTQTLLYRVPENAPETVVNVAIAEGSSSTAVVIDEDDADLFVIREAIALRKTADRAEARPGEPITYTLEVENTGNVTLSALALTDEALGFAVEIPQIEAGQTLLFTLSYIAPYEPGGTVVSNTAVIANALVSAEASAAVVIAAAPGLALRKTASETAVAPGATVTYSIVATNTGNVPLPDVAVSDPLLGIASAPTPLAIGESLTLTGSYTVPAGTPGGTIIANTSTATSSLTPPAQSGASVIVTPAPVLDIAKTADRAVAAPGETIAYTIVVSNPTTAAVEGATVTDDLLGLSETIPSLPPGGQATFQALYVVPANAPAGSVISNAATVTVPEGLTFSAEATVTVAAAPAVSIVKTPSVDSAPAGSFVTYEIAVTNTGNTTLTNIVLTDSVVPASVVIQFLLPGESQSQLFAFRLPNGLAPGSRFANTATVQSDQLPPAQDSAEVLVLPPPAVELVASPFPAYARPGQVVPVTITVTNRSQTTLTNLVVINELTGTNSVFPMLEPGGVITLERLVPIPLGTRAGTELPNVATLTTDQTPTQSAPILIIVLADPAIRLEKSASTAQAIAGETIRFRILGENIGNTSLTGVLTDPLLGIIIGPGTVLYRGRVLFSQPYTIPVETADGAILTNTVRAESLPPGIAATASASVQVLRVLDVTKTADARESYVGAVLRFSVVVANDSAFTATGAVLTDALPPSLAFVPGSLVVGGVPQPGRTLSGGVPLGTIAPGQRIVVAFATRVLSVPRTDGAGDAASGTLSNQAVVAFGVRSPSGRAITTRAVSNRAQVTITEEEE
ncbi:DUF11 domain-containing protein [Paenibacillus albicereus]|uniref:DUF11 domain-containing protein n=1 Tax=Paenibacillus albicereus TaxID=2726185 RepID=A0A6H2GTT3_9BACL|nr:beta-propeller fold lactonase family protein [Paenibacillus albicereus]QJC50802.1 DUF11 domain-containing protein [Paenibacillus albicereus]